MATEASVAGVGPPPAGTRAGIAAVVEDLALRSGDIELRLVSGFELRVGGRLVTTPVGGRRLLAFLALHDRPLRRAFVAGSLWPDEPEERSAARLRGALSRLRQAGLELVLTVDDRLHLDARVVVDVHVVAAAVDRLDELCLPRDCGPWLSTLSGELLPDWYDDWVQVERDRHRQIRLHGLEALCSSLTAAGRYSQAIQAGLASVAADPLRESAHRVLIHAYLEEGNPSEALRQYRRYRDAVLEELGIEPTERMEELVRSFRQAS